MIEPYELVSKEVFSFSPVCSLCKKNDPSGIYILKNVNGFQGGYVSCCECGRKIKVTSKLIDFKKVYFSATKENDHD